MSWLTPETRGTLTPDTIKIGMRVVVHYALQADDTGTVLEVDGHWATIDIDGYDGRLQVPLLIAEMDEINGELGPGVT